MLFEAIAPRVKEKIFNIFFQQRNVFFNRYHDNKIK